MIKPFMLRHAQHERLTCREICLFYYGLLSKSVMLSALSGAPPFMEVIRMRVTRGGRSAFDFLLSHGIACCTEKGDLGIQDHPDRDRLEQWPHSPFGRKSVHEDWVP